MNTLTTRCSKCASKTIGIFKCEGCSQVFCHKHVNEHRDDLRHQLDNIVDEHDQLHQLIHQDGDDHHPLFRQIDQWQEKAIEKIQQAAQKVREGLIQHIRAQKESTSDSLKHLSQRLRTACEDDDYVENDLRTWATKLEELKNNLKSIDSSFTLREDSAVTLIGNINLSAVRQAAYAGETFLRSVGQIDIEDNGLLAIHDQRKSSDAFVYGKHEYQHGKHTIRFVITKANLNDITTFGIASMQSQLSLYGWNSADQTVGCRSSSSQYSDNSLDMKGEITLQIELRIDCDRSKIAYFNERTGCLKEMNVDSDLCPFPWQLYFYLYDTGDRVRLLTTNRT